MADIEKRHIINSHNLSGEFILTHLQEAYLRAFERVRYRKDPAAIYRLLAGKSEKKYVKESLRLRLPKAL